LLKSLILSVCFSVIAIAGWTYTAQAATCDANGIFPYMQADTGPFAGVQCISRSASVTLPPGCEIDYSRPASHQGFAINVITANSPGGGQVETPTLNGTTNTLTLYAKVCSKNNQRGWYEAQLLLYGKEPVCNTVTEIPVAECKELVNLFKSTNGENWTNKTGWNQTNTPCSWFGVTCTAGHVTTIESSGNGLKGQIPNLNLPELTYLGLDNNQLSGSLPNFNLPKLYALGIGGTNQLSGTIPNFNLPELQYLALDKNQLTGNIPDFNLPKLIGLQLNGNKLSGSIPDFNLPKLQYLMLNSNQLCGIVPDFTAFNLSNCGIATFNNNCGLTAHDNNQKLVLDAKDSTWQQKNPNCPAVSTCPASINGTVYNDLNSDGIRQDNEPGLLIKGVWLSYKPESQVFDLYELTDSKGSYSFTPLTAGGYTVFLDTEAGWVQTSSPDKYTGNIANYQTITGLNFGVKQNYAPVASNSSLQTNSGVSVNGTLMATDANGDSLTYSIVTQPTKGTLSPNPSYPNFKYLPNVGITGTDTFTFKANDGKADSNIATVTITVTAPILSGYGSSPAPGSTINVGSATVGSPVSTALSISETGNAPLIVNGLAITGANASDFMITPSSGFKIDDGGSSQNVTIKCTPSVAGARTATLTVTHNAAGSQATYTLNCTGTQIPISYTISGYVKDAGNTAISGVTLTFSNSSTATTDTAGYYSKAFTAAWTGTVTPSKSGYTFTPANRSYSGITTNQTNQNYTGVPPAAFRIWIDKNGNGIYDSGEEVVEASVRVNSETTDRGVTDSQGIIAIPNIANDAKIYAQKKLYSMNNPKAVDSNFANTRSKNPYYAGSVDGKMYDFVMSSDIRIADGTYYDFPGQGKTLSNAVKDAQGNMLIQLVHPKIGWNLVVTFEEEQSVAFYDKVKAGFKSYADYMYNYTDGYFIVKNVVLVKNTYKDTAQWKYCDVQIKNSDWPHSNRLFGNRLNGDYHIYMGKTWYDEPNGYDWYASLGHEAGHYLLGFGDEYRNGNSIKVDGDTWTYRTSHNGDTSGEPNEFPKNYGIMDDHYYSHEMSDTTDYYPRTYSALMDPDLVTYQFMLRQGQSCWAYFKSYYQSDIKQQMAANGLTGFSDAFFNNLIIPPHLTGSYPTSDRTKRNYPSVMNHDVVNFIDWTPVARRSQDNSDTNVFDGLALVTDESGSAVANADVLLVSSDRKSFQGKSGKDGIVKCGSLLIGKKLEAYHNGRKAEVLIDAVKERYTLILPMMKDKRDNTSGIVISATPDVSDSKRLTVTVSGNALSSAPSVTLSQSFAYSMNVPMNTSGANQYSGIADCQYDSGILQVTSGGSQSVSPFEIFTTEVGPASGYYAPNGELEMAYGPNSFTGSGYFAIMNSSAPAPPNNGLMQIGNVYSFGFSGGISNVKDVVLTIRLPMSLPSGVNLTQLNLYGWDVQSKTWNLIPGGVSNPNFFSTYVSSVNYTSYAIFAISQANDSYPPDPVTKLTASTGNADWNVNLSWAAPGDNVGVFAYDLRFSTVPITESNWNSSIRIGSVPKAASPGTVQSMAIEMPDPDAEYYFAIRATDGAGNLSSLTTLSSPVISQSTDTDGDGMPDLWESSHGVNPNVNDAMNDDDGDGLTNIQEYQYHTDPKNSDTDGDGYSDKDEIAKGTDPTDFKSHINLSSNTPGDLDCDDNVTLSDAIIALRIVSSIDPPSLFCKNDVNGDNRIGLEEVVYILQKVAGLR